MLLDLLSQHELEPSIVLNDDGVGGVPEGAEVWTMDDLALAALLDPRRLAMAREVKRSMPTCRIPSPFPRAPAALRLPRAGADIEWGFPRQLQEHISIGPPILYAGWANSGRVNGIGVVKPMPVLYLRSEDYRHVVPDRAEVWTPGELATLLKFPDADRVVLRRWKQQHGRWATLL